MFDDIFNRLDTIQYANVADRRTDGRTPADTTVRANPWRRVVKTIFAHTHTIIRGYGVIPERIRLNKSAELVFGIVPTQTRQLVSTYSLAMA